MTGSTTSRRSLPSTSQSGLGVIEVGTYAPLLPEDQRELLAIIDSIDVVENP